jgi:CHAD domain-containing protein
MSHRIGRHETVGKALRRLIADDLAAAQADLRSNGSAEERIHRIRQRLKRLRTLLRVVKPALPGEVAAATRALSAAARLLAEPRDADVAAASARGLREIAAPGEDAGLDRVVAELDRKAEEAHHHAAPVRHAGERLATAEAALDRLARDLDGKALFEKALARSYRKGREAMGQAQSSLATPDLHRWRKAVKDYWTLIRLARKRLPPQLRSTASDLERLGELLGLDHDHAVLAERLALSPEPDPALMRHLSLIARERRRLEDEAFRLGAGLYRRRPKKQANRLALS